jgi:hypothetical protein
MANDDGTDIPEEEQTEPRLGRITNRSVWDAFCAMNDRCNTLDQGQSDLLCHIDKGFESLRDDSREMRNEMSDLRKGVNDSLHVFDRRLRPIERGWDIKTALLKGSWKLTTLMIGAAAVLASIFTHFGLPWQWGP